MRRSPLIAHVVAFVLSGSSFAASTNVPASVGSGGVTLPSDEAVFARFLDWAQRHSTQAAVGTPEAITQDVIQLARTRRVALQQLIEKDPARALHFALAPALRSRLPREVVELLESHVSGIGDLTVVADPVERHAYLQGKTYRAYVYSRRLDQSTKTGIPLYGIAIDDALAVHERPLRELAAEEASIVGTVSAFPLPTAAASAQVSPVAHFGLLGGGVYPFSSGEHMARVEQQLIAAEAGINPTPARSLSQVLAGDEMAAGDEVAANTAWGTGHKSVLVIRVDFSDIPGEPRAGDTVMSPSYVQNIADTQIAPFFEHGSYGRTTIGTTVTTQVYRMPQTSSSYLSGSSYTKLHSDAQAAAAAHYSVAAYDRLIVLFSQIGYGWAGRGQIGGKAIWQNGNFSAGTVRHELGHTYGLWHAGRWQVTDGNPISAGGTNVDYGDPFDTMGVSHSEGEFNPAYKAAIGWIPETQVERVEVSGTYRLDRFDNGLGTGKLALSIIKDSGRTYWIGCRRDFVSNASMQNGAYIIWAYDSAQPAAGWFANGRVGSALLDMTTPGSDEHDAALSLGQAFNDPVDGITIEIVGKGGSAPSEYLDVRISLPPVVTLEPKGRAVLPGAATSFTVAAKGASSFRWQRLSRGSSVWEDLTNGELYAGVTSDTLTLARMTAEMDGDNFRCLLTNASGTRTSAAAAATIPRSVSTISRSLQAPVDVAVGSDGSLYVADAGDSTIRKITPDGAITLWAGYPHATGHADGDRATARFSSPRGIAIDASGTLWVADSFNNTIRKILPSGEVITVAGTPGQSGHADGTGSAARFNWPYAISAGPYGSVHVVDTHNHTVRQISSSGVVSTIAGVVGQSGSADGSVSEARFQYPSDIIVAADGSIFVQSSHSIRRIFNGIVSTLAGSGDESGSADGIGAAARFNYPVGLALSPAGDLYVTDQGNSTIRKVTVTGSVATVAGSPGLHDTVDGIGADARLSSPGRPAFAGTALVFPDVGAGAIRKAAIPAAPILLRQPSDQVIAAGETAVFYVSAAGEPAPSFQWTKNGVALVGATHSTLTIPNAQPADQGSYAVVVSNVIESTTSAAAGLTVKLVAPSIRSHPSSRTAPAGSTVVFDVVATGTRPLEYQWQHNGSHIPGATAAALTLHDVRSHNAGTYSVRVSNAAGDITSNPADLTVDVTSTPTPTPTPATPPSPTATPQPTGTASPTATPSTTIDKLGNISTRLSVGTGEDVLIGGFIISGSEPKTLLLRGIGPSLPVPNPLVDPVMDVYDGAGERIASNDDWANSPNVQDIVDTTIPPSHQKESAIVHAFEPGSYTAVVAGTAGGTGVGLIEAYDLKPSGDSKLANIATRGVVQTGDDVMIGGLILLGTNPQRVIVRAIGPSLRDAGVASALADPMLELVDSYGNSVATNDNWRDWQESEVADTTIPPSNDAESAIVSTLAPGAYTAVVRGKDDGTGVALVEVYGLQ